MVGEDFCLKWNDHHSIFFSSVEQLCRGEILTDVTLSCGSVDFYAHKLVLSVCSGYFSGLFSRKFDKHKSAGNTVVYLKDVEPRHMELILSYMYRGEINVEESELVGLLSTAKGLQIKGLTDSNEELTTRSRLTTSGSLRCKSEEESSSSPSKSASKRKDNRDEVLTPKRIKEECPLIPEENVSMELNPTSASDPGAFPNDDHDELDDEYHIPEGGGPYIHEPHHENQSGGPVSHKVKPFVAATTSTSIYANVGSMAHHHQPSTAQLQHPQQQQQQQPVAAQPTAHASKFSPTASEHTEKILCQFCDKGFTHRWMLERHLVSHTGAQNYACGICWRRFSLQPSCVRHIKNVHRETCAGQENLSRLVIKYPAQHQHQPPIHHANGQ